MSEFILRYPYDDIVNQPEIEYRTAKYPEYVRMEYRNAETGEIIVWDSPHCPVCFYTRRCWDSLISKGTKFCPECGQKIKWKEDETE